MGSTNAPMQAPGIPADELLRLMALHGLGLLDSAADEAYDRVTRLAARALDAPIVLVSLVDRSRQWFKSCVGLDAREISREISFCGHAILQTEPFVVRDAALDARFAGNPLVTGAPHIRAYLGIPLRTRAGLAIGTLCAIDRRPRTFSADEMQIFVEYAQIVQQIIQAEEQTAQIRSVVESARENEQLYRQTFEQAAVGMVHTAIDGRLLRVNQAFCRMLGFEPAELCALSFLDITHPDDVAPDSHQFQRLLSGEMPSFEVEKRYLRKDGDYIWAHLSCGLKRNAARQVEYAIAVVEDISARKRVEAELLEARDTLQQQVAAQTRKLQEANDALRRQSKATFESTLAVCRAEVRLRTIANSVPAMIGYWDAQLRCEFANRAYHDWFGSDPNKIMGMSMPEFLGPELFAAVEPHVRLALSGHEQQFERPHLRADGRPMITDTRYLPDTTDSGETRGFYVLVTDVTALREAQRALEQLNAKLVADSVTDYLTGLCNRRLFSQRSEEALRRFNSDGQPYGLILLDLDDFKRINDRYGHDVGDEVLRAVGRILRSELRDVNDVAARLGGEELALLCVGTADETALCQLAERLRVQISRESVPSALGLVHFTGSFGVSSCRAGDSGWKHIYARADAALYQAKTSGEDRVVYEGGAVEAPSGRFRALCAG
jgi:diguanylate cyclase (GGDEF)-like protein/PAS domain S-box-containing protein